MAENKPKKSNDKKKEELDKKNNKDIEDKELDFVEAEEDEDSKYYDFDDTIKKVFEEPKPEVDDDDEEIAPQEKEGYKVQSQILETEKKWFKTNWLSESYEIFIYWIRNECYSFTCFTWCSWWI